MTAYRYHAMIVESADAEHIASVPDAPGVAEIARAACLPNACEEDVRRVEAEVESAMNSRALEQELLAFKLDTETKLTEEARKLSGVIVDQRKIGENVDLAAADSTLGRLKEVELALLKEREMRKTLEHEVVAIQTLALTNLSPNQPQP